MSDTAEQSLTLETITSQLAKFEPDRVDELIAAAQAHAKSIVADVSTRKGRELRKSEAYKISQTKVRVINLIDESIEDAKKAVKIGTTAKAKITDAFDATRDEIKAPALEWEAKEEARKAAIRERIFEIESQTDQLSLLSVAEISARVDEVNRLSEFDFAEATEKAAEIVGSTVKRLGDALAARKQYEAEQAELKRLREAEAKRQEEEAARKAEEERKARELKEAEEAKAKAEAEAKAAAEREKQRKIEEAARIKAAEEAAAKRERERLEAEADAKAEKERKAAAAEKAKRDAEELTEAKRKANWEHRRKVMREATDGMMQEGPISEENARNIIHAIERGEIPHVTLNF